MPRQPRKYSVSNVYHVMYKGIDGNDIFYDENDKKVFLNKILEIKDEFVFKIYAYCLMNNHIHLVIETESQVLSNLMKSLSIRYISYFNKKYLRSGPFFQDRFNSKCVENQNYFLNVCRYIHQNPEKAGICRTIDYKWSSMQEYLVEEKLINKKVLLHYFDNDIKKFKVFNLKDDGDEYGFMEYEFRTKLDDWELAEIITKKLDIESINDISKMDQKKRKDAIRLLKDLRYTNISQISRVTRIERKFVERVFSQKREKTKK